MSAHCGGRRLSFPVVDARRGTRALAGLAAALTAAAAPAAEPPAAELPLWEAGIGVGALHLPHYRGARQSNDWLLPLPFFIYRGEVVRADRDGIRAKLIDSDRIDFDLSGSASAPVRSEDDDAREGMPDLDGTVELGPNLNLTLARGTGWKLDFRVPVRASVTLDSNPRFIGWAAVPNVNLDRRLGAWNLGLNTGPTFATRRYHAHFYSVAPAFATAERPAYSASGGYGGWQGTAALSRRDGNRWTGMFVKVDHVGGARFEASPLVQRRTTVAFGVALSWSIWRSDRLVPDRDAPP
jgi:MipA family protein